MKPLGGKPKREYEMSEKERLLNQIRKANNEADHAKRSVRSLEIQTRELIEQSDRNQLAYSMFNFLKHNEVFIADEEGMKVLNGDDLVEYCKAGLLKEDAERHAGYQTISLGSFIQPYQQHINAIFDDVYKEHTEQMMLTYKTKGRYK